MLFISKYLKVNLKYVTFFKTIRIKHNSNFPGEIEHVFSVAGSSEAICFHLGNVDGVRGQKISGKIQSETCLSFSLREVERSLEYTSSLMNSDPGRRKPESDE